MQPRSAPRATPIRTQSVASKRRRGARNAQVVAFPGRIAPESAYNLAGDAGPARAAAMLRR